MSRAFVLDRVEYDRFSRCKQFERLFYNDCNKSVAMKAFLTTSEPRTQRGALFIALQIYGYELHRGLGYREAKYKRHRAALKSSLFIIAKQAQPRRGWIFNDRKIACPMRALQRHRSVSWERVPGMSRERLSPNHRGSTNAGATACKAHAVAKQTAEQALGDARY